VTGLHREPLAPPDTVVLRPNVASEDWRDALLTLAAGLPLMLVVVAWSAAAGLLGYAATHDTGLARWAAMVALLGVVLYASLTGVRWLRVDAYGLRFGRRRGRPRSLPWADVLSVEPAPRKEVVVRGWLWPPLARREPTGSLSSFGHYRIKYRGGTCYFPPVDAVAFRTAIRRWRRDLLQSEAGF
jgi:hypothetical protein